jgi:glycosyltransferase involved in cell wall biosynthesis
VLSLADGLIAVSDGVKEDLVSRHPEAEKKRWTTISNGFDDADFAGLVPKTDPDRFILTYTGSLYGKRNPLVLLEALRSLLSEKPRLRNKILLRFVGRADSSYLDAFSDLGGAVETVPYVPHRESLQFLMDSSALLLIIDDAPASRSIATGKLYEYAGARKPILALAPEGAAADVVRSLDEGVVVPPGDLNAVRKALETLVERWEKHGLSVHSGDGRTDQYERKHLTGRLAEWFDGLVQ